MLPAEALVSTPGIVRKRKEKKRWNGGREKGRKGGKGGKG